MEPFFTCVFRNDFTATRIKIQVSAPDKETARTAMIERLNASYGDKWNLLGIFEDSPMPQIMTPEAREAYYQANAEKREQRRLEKQMEERARIVERRQREISRKDQEANARTTLREEQRRKQLSRRIATE